MAFRYFPGETAEWLKARLTELNEEDVTDKTVTGWTEAGSSASKYKGNRSAAQRKREVLHDLNVLEPAEGWIDSAPSRSSRAIFVDQT